MVLQRLFKPRAARQIGADLYQAVTLQARRPQFYQALAVPDTMTGRFEVYNLHVVILLNRLKGLGGLAGEVSQALFDAYVRSLDDALRNSGVGDLSVGKKMRKLAEAFYGRAKAYDSALAAQGEELRDLVARTLYADQPDGPVADMVAYIARAQAALATQSLDDLLGGSPAWPEVAA